MSRVNEYLKVVASFVFRTDARCYLAQVTNNWFALNYSLLLTVHIFVVEIEQLQRITIQVFRAMDDEAIIRYQNLPF